ncbi:MAG: phosphoribosylformylglycinamidine synthase subunit PurS [Calditrichaeota bacterium]|nr:phosphoribosylformylglycinamidine synthase subunit PurS [Calditrichota bacterium]
MKSIVHVQLKQSILDPQGQAVNHAIEHLNFNSVKDVRIGKLIELSFNGVSREEAEKQTTEICEKLLINPVIETYSFQIED